MGQRHQIFIKTENPVYKENTRIYDKAEMKKLRKLFGRKKHTVIPLHHQWLYGRSAPAMLWSILNATNPKTMGSNNPFHSEYYIYRGIDDYIQDIMSMVQVNTCPLSPRGIGIERMHFLLEDDYTIMREDFTMGDNNDGVLIIDAIERKYCFMNVSEHWQNEIESTSISYAPYLVPLSAREYMDCYYPETAERIDNDNENHNTNILNNMKLEKLIQKDFEPSVLTLKEVKKIFPKVFKKVLA
jgi:hypothetical protein